MLTLIVLVPAHGTPAIAPMYVAWPVNVAQPVPTPPLVSQAGPVEQTITPS